MGFVNLHNHTSGGSFLDGLQSVDEMVKWAKKNGQKYVGLTEHGNLYSTPSFIKKCEEEGITPIVGCEMYYTSRYAGSKELKNDERKHQYHLTVLAKNNEGYKNLLKLVSLANTVGQYFQPCTDFETIKAHSEGLIVLSGCMSAYIPQLILDDKHDMAIAEAERFRDLLGEDYYLELMKHPVHEFSDIPKQREDQEWFVNAQDKILEGLYHIEDKLSIPSVVTNDAHYCLPEDHELHDIVYAMGQGKAVSDPDRRRFSASEFYMKTEEEMLELFPAEPVRRTVEIAEKCNINFDEIYDGKSRMPHFPKIPEGMTEDEYMAHLAREGLKRLGLADKQKYIDRLEHEIEVITRLGWSGYFLILWDVMEFCNREGIIRSYGRGSSAGSLVSYTLDITKVDPIEYDLLFERFLDESRVSPPDIDCDFPQHERQKVIDYTIDLYGEGNVVQIGTMSVMGTKGAIKKVATAFEVPFSKANQLTNAIPNDFKGSILDTLEIEEVKRMYTSDPSIKKVIDIAEQVHGMPQHAGVHAAGIVISPSNVVEHIPIRSAKGVIVTQWDMDEVEEFGGLKMDFLGLKTLDIIDYTVKEVKRNRGIDIDIFGIDKNDESVYQLLSKADTSGVFQLESNLCRGYLSKMRPTAFNHLVDFLALIRPGPLKAPSPSGSGTLVDEYIMRMQGKSKPIPPHPLLSDVLKDTYHTMIFQESVMRAARDMAGFTASESDVLRKVIGGSKKDAIRAQIDKFIEGSVANGVSRSDAESVGKLIENFGSYGFNKCVDGNTLVYMCESPDTMDYTKIKIKDLYDRWQSGVDDELYILSYDEANSKIIKNNVVDVVSSGRRRVYRITTLSGKTIEATRHHKFLTSYGWKKLEDLEKDMLLWVSDLLPSNMEHHGEYGAYMDRIWKIERVRGYKETYDIEMEAPAHNFIANNIVTHNSHSVSYAYLSIQTAYLRANFLQEFVAALVTFENEPEVIGRYISEAFNSGVKILPPSINISTDKFVSDGDAIRFSLAVKGCGKSAVSEIVSEVEANGPYKSFRDFIDRSYGNAVTKTAIESLARCGAMDEFGLTRKQMAECVPAISKAHTSYRGKIKRIEDRYDLMTGWDDIAKVEKEREKLEERRVKAQEVFDEAVDSAIKSIEGEYTDEELASYEMELMGHYILYNPLNRFRGQYNQLLISQPPLVTSSSIHLHKDKTVSVIGMIDRVNHRKARYGPSISVNLQDWGGSIQAVAYNRQVERYKGMLQEGKVVVMIGRVIHYKSSGSYGLRIDSVKLADENLPENVIMVFVEDGKVGEVSSKVKSAIKTDIVPTHEYSVVVIDSERSVLLDKDFPDYEIDLIRNMDGVIHTMLVQ